MAFPVSSVSTITKPIVRVIRVMGRSQADPLIHHGGVYVCKKISGSNTYSQHSWGNAVDLFPEPDAGSSDAVCRNIAEAVVTQTKKRTKANRGRKLDVSEVIDHANSRIWVKGSGWRAYGGTVGPHVHVSGDPKKTGIPPCAS